MLMYPYLLDDNNQEDNITRIVTWAEGTNVEIKKMIDAADVGEIDPTDYWAVGDERTVRLGAMEVGDGLHNAQPEQDVVLVLMNYGGYKDTKGENINFVWGQKDCLSEYGRMNATGTNEGSWGSCAMRNDLNTIYYNALPEIFRTCLKQFKTITAEKDQTAYDTEVQINLDFIALFTEKEIFGNKINGSSVENLAQIEWYKISSNRIKKRDGNAVGWWLRSPYVYQYSNNDFCYVTYTGSSKNSGATYNNGIAPFGCI